MGYYERKFGAALFTGIMVVFVACLVAVGPWVIGNAVAGPVLGWVFELIYIGLIVWLVVAQVRKARARAVAAYLRASARDPHRW